jgi:hypothetical protein
MPARPSTGDEAVEDDEPPELHYQEAPGGLDEDEMEALEEEMFM